MGTVIGWVIAIVAIAAVLIALAAWFYERATREISLVRTGIGGRRVVMDGGVVAVPWFHEVSRVNMKTLRLEVRRSGEASLITKDRMRVDVGAEFYVAVQPEEDGIARAVQTLGAKTFHADQLRELIEGKLVDALRAVAARMTMDELHENRGQFVREVREALAETLSRNGLDLESVSLTALDQTPFRSLDENNAFNAVGMRKLAEVIAKSKKDRAEIDADAEVSVRQAAVEATKRRLQIELEEQTAQIEQVRRIETLRAAQLADIARQKAASEQASAEARIAMERDIRSADIAREIAISEKSKDESRARAEADKARAEAVKQTEALATVRRLAEAEREKQVAKLAAEREAETSAIAAEAKKRGMQAEAEGRKAMIAADNALSPQAAGLKVDLARLEAMPRIVAEMVKPAERIEKITIHQISGLGGSNAAPGAAAGAKPVINQALDSILDMAVQLPALKAIGEEIGETLEAGVKAAKGKGRAAKEG